MGDFEEVERLQAGIREWLLRSARNGRHELRGMPAPAVLPVLCAAAFGPLLGDASDLTGTGTGTATAGAATAGRIKVLSSVGADVLADVLDGAAGRARSAQQSLQREISRSIGQILAAQDKRADDLRSDIAMVMREIDAGGTVFRAAIETGNEELEHEVLAAIEAVSAEFGDMAFMLADLARAAGEIQDSLGGRRTDLRTATEQAGRQSADVRMIREELAVIERRSSQWIPDPADREDPGPRWAGGCPYRGLLPYDQAQQAVFFGRERLTAELAGKLAETGIVMVTGASGAGKTSLLRAGLVPALARGVQVPGSPSWPRVCISATARPLTDLADGLALLGGGDPVAIRRALADAPGDAHFLISEIMQASAERDDQHTRAPGEVSRLVLIIDQFEQVFDAAGEEARLERTAFIDAVCAAAMQPAGPAGPAGSRGEPPARVVIAVRGDYWDRCAAYPQLMRAMEQDQLVVGPMQEAGLRRAIAGPAEASGLRVESALIDAVLADVRAAADEHGAGVLPLLSQAMMLTWKNREGEVLAAAGYDRAGRIARAVEVSAEAVYDGLPEDQQAIARDVLRRMTTVGHDRRPARRPVTRGNLRAGRPKEQWLEVGAVLDAFTRSHLLVLGTNMAQIAHDALLESWPRLRDWLEEDQASLILYGQLAEDTALWRKNGKDSSLLYQGIKLAAATEAARVWETDPGRYPALTADEADFLRGGGRVTTRGRWRRRTLAGALAVLLIAALTAAGLAVRSARNTADQQRTADLAGRLAAQSTALDALNPVTASLLAGAAWRIAPTAQARYSLLQSLAQPVRGILAAQSGAVTALAYNPDGHTLAAGYQDGTIRLWDLAAHHLISTAAWGRAALALAFTGGGKAVEVASPGAIGVWNLTSRAKIPAQPLAGVTTGRAVAFSPDGKVLATGGDQGNLRLWDTATQQEIGAPMSSGLKPVDAVAFSPDGTMVAAASNAGTIQLWDAASQLEVGTTMVAGSAAVKVLAFSPDGKVLATGGGEGNVQLWDTATQTQAGTTMATGDAVAALSFSASGTTLATAEGNGATELWGVATQDQTGAPLAAQGSGGVSALAFGSGAGALATGDGNGTIRLWDPAGFHQASAPLATGTPEQPAAAAGHAPLVLSADDILAVSEGRGIIRLWNVRTRRRAGVSIASHHVVTGLALSRDGKTLAVAAGGLTLWSTANGRRTGGPVPAPGGGFFGALAFSPDGTLLATTGSDGKARLWNVATQQETGAPMTVGALGSVALSPDGKTLATVGANGVAKLWNVATQRQIGDPMTAQAPEGTRTTAVAFSPDGTTLATASGDGSARRWHVAFPSRLLPAACAIASQSLTRQQWAGYAETQPFQQVCPAS